MSIHRSLRTPGKYTTMGNHHFKNNNLSAKAKGVLSQMLSLQDDWKFSVRGLTKLFSDGEDSIRAALNELEHKGHLVRNRIRLPNGRLGEVVYDIYEQPICTDTDNKPERDFPVKDESGQALPKQDNMAQYNTNEYKNIEKKDKNDQIDTYAYRKIIENHIEYDKLLEVYDAEKLNAVVELMLEEIISQSPFCIIAKQKLPREIVRSRMLKINTLHVEYVFECLDKATGRIANPKAYLLTALYNAPTTMEQYYSSEANHYEPPTYIRKQRRSDNSTH